jgi:RNA polymerase sigma factor
MEHLDVMNEKVNEAKLNKDVLNEFVEAYKPFIATEISKTLKSYVDPQNNEYMTMGMMAFIEAIKCYDDEKGAFIPLAKKVIRNRVIDEIRINARSNLDCENVDDPMAVQELSISKYILSVEQAERKQVINEYRNELIEWDIDFWLLAEKSPKSKKNKTLYKRMAQYIVESPILYKQVIETKRLPIATLVNEFQVNSKKVDRGRVFIIACIILMEPKYIMLSDYIN